MKSWHDFVIWCWVWVYMIFGTPKAHAKCKEYFESEERR